MYDELIRLFKQASKKNTIVSVFADANHRTAASVGYVDVAGKQFVRLKSVSPEGENDGLIVRRYDEIFRVDLDGKYEKTMETLFAHEGQVFCSEEQAPVGLNGGDLVSETLKYAEERQLVVTVWPRGSETSISGYVAKIGAQLTTIRALDKYGAEDGKVVLKSGEVGSVDCNTRDEQKLAFLNRIHRGGRRGRP